ncbi:centaurin-gamma-1A isoform X2 [Amyelois transitella]|uniref:centaurin-gamma-1A isoform X2 n=1 Tax=Amyelois transitella TaxID=680683 RepID=UPI00298FFA77|nr:centaurin-gamma-1A isoform X2 [Amyelois transitella]
MLGFRSTMCNRQHSQACLNTSLSIRQEIQRFESVHPSIYALYDLVELVPDPLLAQQIRDHVVAIEDSFVNSQEWTAARGVTELRVGVLGSPDSGKSALVHRYLTGAYMQEESPEGRFKKEVIIDGHSYLLLIRDEGGPPEMQFTAWVDAVIFVFSLENEISYNTVSNYFNKMSHYRNSAEIPIILVGTQDAISESSPRVVDDNRARKLSNELRRCSYYETCATYGLNVERVFQDACQKIVGTRLSASSQCLSGSRPVTPQPLANSPSHNHTSFLYKDSLPRGHHTLSASSHHLHRGASSFDASSNSSGISSTHVVEIHSTNGSDTSSRWGNSLGSHGSSSGLVSIATENNNVKFTAPHCLDNLQPVKDSKDLPTPSSTPTTSRKSRRRSNLFTPSKKGDDRLKNGELGSGRAIPLKQGYLYKKSSKALNKEWKKKYVTLCDDGRLTYHPSLHDYMEDVNGKEISLQYVTVKVPGQKPRGSKSVITTVPGYNGYSSLDIHDSIGGLSLGYKDKPQRATDKALMSAFDTMKEPASSRQSLASEAELATNGGDKDTPHVKKRHRRMKSSGVKNNDDEAESPQSYSFSIVSLAGKRWRWEVAAGGGGPGAAAAERDAWVAALEAQILASLQGRTSRQPAPTGANSTGDVRATYYIRRVKGNDKCCDCEAQDPDWASLNLGVLICIECSGIHRNLGSHISRVRSLDLDEWPLGHVSVMVSMGNALANSIWEADLRGHIKPMATSTREEKERWIRLKYERRAFLPPDEAPPSPEALRTAGSRGALAALARLLSAPPPRAPAAHDRAVALRAAAAAGQLAAAQLLIWHNGNPNYPDADGHTCVFYARAAANHLSGIPTQYPKNLQLACPLHPDPPVGANSSGTNSTSSTSSAKSNVKNPEETECNCIIFELLNAQSASNALVELLIGLQNNQYMNGYENNGVSSSYSHGTLGRPSLAPSLSLTNGKCGSIV